MPDKGLQGVVAGDALMVSQYGRAARPATVDKVGRKYVTIEGRQYFIDTGTAADGYPGHAQTPAQHAADVERTQMVNDLRVLGVELTHRTTVTTEQLRALLAVYGSGGGGGVTDLDPDKIKAAHADHEDQSRVGANCAVTLHVETPCLTYQLADALARTREWGEAYFNEAQTLRAQLAAVRIRDTIRDTQAERHQQL